MKEVDREVKRLLKALPNEEVLQLLKEFKETKCYSNYNGALDAFAFKFGIDAIYAPHMEKNLYRPYIKYYPDNALSSTLENERLSDEFMTLNKCEQLGTKELIYRLMRVKNPKSYLK